MDHEKFLLLLSFCSLPLLLNSQSFSFPMHPDLLSGIHSIAGLPIDHILDEKKAHVVWGLDWQQSSFASSSSIIPEQAPSSLLIQYDNHQLLRKSKNYRWSLGGRVFSQDLHPLRQVGTYLNSALHLKIGEATSIGAGLNSGVYQFRVKDENALRPYHLNDPWIEGARLGQWYWELGVGLSIHHTFDKRVKVFRRWSPKSHHGDRIVFNLSLLRLTQTTLQQKDRPFRGFEPVPLHWLAELSYASSKFTNGSYLVLSGKFVRDQFWRPNYHVNIRYLSTNRNQLGFWFGGGNTFVQGLHFPNIDIGIALQAVRIGLSTTLHLYPSVRRSLPTFGVKMIWQKERKYSLNRS
ncbi:MAG: type IX secretion system membrane protein PorP/SprF [Bacteroidota bacterium]